MDELRGLLEIFWPMVEQVPYLPQILTILSILRFVNKPLFAILKAIFDITPTIKDNELLEKIVKSKAYAVFTYVLDWVFSVKLPQKKDLK